MHRPTNELSALITNIKQEGQTFLAKSPGCCCLCDLKSCSLRPTSYSYRSPHISHQKLRYWFLTLNVIQGQIWLYQSKAHGSASNLVSVTIFKIFRIKGLWPSLLTYYYHPKWSPWAHYIISVRSNIVTLALLDIVFVKKYDLVFDPSRSSKVKSDGAQSKAHRNFPIWPLLSPTKYLSSFGHKSPVWPTNQPTTQPTKYSYNVCRNRSSMQHLQPGPNQVDLTYFTAQNPPNRPEVNVNRNFQASWASQPRATC